jgi:hypothetical protein
MTMSGGGGGEGNEPRLPSSPSTLNRITPILLVTAEIEHARPGIAYLCKFPKFWAEISQPRASVWLGCVRGRLLSNGKRRCS